MGRKHIKSEGKLLLVDKRFSELKLRQKDWIGTRLSELYKKTALENDGYVGKQQEDVLLAQTYSEIQEAGINIRYEEVEKYFKGKLSRYRNRVAKRLS